MSPTSTSVFATAQRMEASGLPRTFIVDVLRESLESEGIYDLLLLWDEASTEQEREAVVGDLSELLLDREPPVVRPAVRDAADIDAHIADVTRWKDHLRAVIDHRGGVTEVARLAMMAQPALSRLLRSASMPRASTIERLAAAMGIPESDISYSTFNSVERGSQRGTPGLPSGYSGAACESPPDEFLPATFRVVRISGVDGESVVQEFQGGWKPGKTRSKVVVGFRGIRLLREETISFRLDWRFGDGEWQRGPATPLEVDKIPAVEAEKIRARMADQGT